MLAQVIVLTPAKGVDQLSYEIPAAMTGKVRPGHRVLVPLRSRKLTGIVVRTDENSSGPQVAGLKPLLEILGPRPILDDAHLKLLEFIASYYLLPLPEVYRAVMPGALRVESSQQFFLRAQPSAMEEAAFNPVERALVDALRKRPMTARQIEKRCGEGEAASALRRMLAEGLIERREAVRGRHREPVITTVRLKAGIAEARPRGERQRSVLSRLEQAPGSELMLDVLERAIPAARSVVRTLVQRGLVEIAESSIPCELGVSESPLQLTNEQEIAVNTVARALEEKRFESFLLWGVTASGKTEVYLQLAAKCIEIGRQALVMVPEIALTDYLVQSFRKRFGSIVAVAHSGQNIAERWGAWNASLSGQARILLGPRSALFAPLHDLGLIVVDEEHDPAYKQEESLRYHARDLAVVLARLSSCPVVMGSATPAAESFANARSGRYRLLQLRHRIGDRAMAPVEVVDLRREARTQAAPDTPPPVPLSTTLVEALRATLSANGQSLVFINRRGYHNFLNCNQCGNVLSCPDCSVSMTFHLRDRSLRCHYCGHYRAAPDACPACHGFSLQGQGFGTERLQAALARILPEARIERMDSDTSRRKGARHRILSALAKGEIDILVGTQMITKGFDFPGVTMVGVVMADLSLNLPDFRSAERTFQLLTQAAGRAGRGTEPGRVVIQTYAPHHYSIRAAQHQDYARFIRRELELRRELGYPPYARLALIRLEGADGAAAERLATRAASQLARLDPAGQLRVLGPAPAPIERIKQRYRWQLMVKAASWSQMKDALRSVRDELAPVANREDIQFSIDIDPVHML